MNQESAGHPHYQLGESESGVGEGGQSAERRVDDPPVFEDGEAG